MEGRRRRTRCFNDVIEYDYQSVDVDNKEKTDEEAAKRKAELLAELQAMRQDLKKKAKDESQKRYIYEADNEEDENNEQDAANNEEDDENNRDDVDDNQEDVK
ncbi:hypothetical protein Tco_1483559 [Tanacetum coccineum]